MVCKQILEVIHPRFVYRYSMGGEKRRLTGFVSEDQNHCINTLKLLGFFFALEKMVYGRGLNLIIDPLFL